MGLEVTGSINTIQTRKRQKLQRKHWSGAFSHYAKIDPLRKLSPSTIYTRKTKYLQELAKRWQEKDITTDIKELPSKKRGHPLRTELDLQV